MLSKSECRLYAFCIGFSAILVVLFSLGVYFLVEAAQDPHSSEVDDVEDIIADWDHYRPSFQVLKLDLESTMTQPLLPSTAVDFTFDDDDLDYDPLKFYANDTIFALDQTFNVTVGRRDVTLNTAKRVQLDDHLHTESVR
jgi:hypothetical protein